MTQGLETLLSQLPALASATGLTPVAANASTGGQVVTYKGKRYRQVQTSAGAMLIPFRRAHRIVIGEKGLLAVLSLIRTGAAMGRSHGRRGTYSFRRHRRRRW